jgi:hypothetical protein
MPATTSGGENAVFIDNIDQLEAGETEDACVAFSASNVWHSVQPGKSNPYSAEDVDQMADNWYTKLTGSIDNSDGMSVPQLQEMLRGMGLSFEEIPLSHNVSDDDKVRQALKDGKLVIICAAESSFFDLEIGRAPYSWNTQPFNHCIVGSGLITSGPYANNIWVRDTVAVSGGYPPSTRRPYDIGKMQYVSLHAVIPSWLKNLGVPTMSGLPSGATDNGTTITFSNGLVMVKGFRARYLQMAAAGDIPADDEPLVNEYPCNPVEQSNPTWWGTSGTNQGSAQETRYFRFGYSPLKGVRVTYVGQELHWYQQQLTGARG